jgi:N-acetylmuramoyl-L-alanine amidase
MAALVDRPTKNHNARPVGKKVHCLVLHADASRNAKGTVSWIQNPAAGVSYHYLIDRDGTVYRMVPDERRAWHAGRSEWLGTPNVNDISIGVSWSNDQKGEPFTPEALASGADLCAQLCRRHHLTPCADSLVTHEQIARPVGRKRDQGPLFPLDQFRADVRALWEVPNDVR